MKSCKYIQYIKIKDLIFAIIVLVIVAVSLLVLIYIPKWRDVTYKLKITETSYDFPKFNVTIFAQANVPVEVIGYEIYYRDQHVGGEKHEPFEVNEGDRYTLLLNLNVNIAKGEVLIIYLLFSDNSRMRFEVEIP